MSKMTHRASTRINEDIYNDITKIAEDNRISRSDVIRLSLEGNLQKETSKKNKTLPADDREKMLKQITDISGMISQITRHNSIALNNINQIARSRNSGDSEDSLKKLTKETEVYKLTIEVFNEYIYKALEVLNDIWHTLG